MWSASFAWGEVEHPVRISREALSSTITRLWTFWTVLSVSIIMQVCTGSLMWYPDFTRMKYPSESSRYVLAVYLSLAGSMAFQK